MYIPKMIRSGWTCLFWCLMLAAMPASAQFTESNFSTNPQHTAITRDKNNNIYTVSYDASGRVSVLKRSGGNWYFVYSAATNAIIDWTYFWGIAVNSKGDVYLGTSIADFGGGQLLRLRYTGTGSGYAPVEVVRQNEGGFTALVFDQQDNLLALKADLSGHCALMKYAANQEGGTGVVLADGSSITGGFDLKETGYYPWGLAVDKDNTIYFTTCLNPVYFLTGSSNAIYRLKQGETAPTLLRSGNITSLACDDYGNLYSIELGRYAGLPASIIWTPKGDAYGPSIYWTVVSDPGNGYIPWGITVNGDGSVIYFDQFNDPNVTNPVSGGKVLTASPVTVTALSATDPTTTRENTVHYRYNSTPVPYLPSSGAGFSLSTTGTLTGAAVTQVMPDGTGGYKVTVTTTGGDGTLTLKMTGDGLMNPITNKPYIGQTYTIDRTPPTVSFTATPPATTTSTNATFTFMASESPVTYEVQADNGSFTPATSPFTLTGLAAGPHVLSVRAKDQAGNTSASATYNWTIVTAPVVTSVAVPVAKYYHAADPLVFDVAFDQNLIVFTNGGTPYIDLTIGSQVKQARFTGSPSPGTMRFSYMVSGGDEDMDGITVNALNFNGAIVTNGSGVDATTTLNNVGSTAGVKVNTTMPTCVISMSTPSPVNGDFILTAVFSEAVTGVSAATLNIIGATVTFQGGTDNIYTFKISPTTEGAYSVNIPVGRAIQAVGGNNNQQSNTINFVLDKTAPKVSSVTVPAPQYYKAGTNLDFDVTFNEDILVSTTGGTPSVQLNIGGATKQATFLSSPAPNVARFRYTVANGDNDMDGIVVNTLSNNGGSIRDAATNNADLALNNIGNTTGVLVNTVHPTVSITAPAYVNSAFTATITFSEVASLFKPANMSVGNAVLSNMVTSDSITFTVTVMLLGDGPVTIQVPANGAVNIAGNGSQASNTLRVTADRAVPVVSGVTVPAAGYYKIGSNLDFDVAFNEDITATTTGGTPYVNITIGSQVRQALYVSSPNTTTMRFRYTVVPQDENVTGITVNALDLHGGVIRDLAGNDADITLKNIGSTSGIKVNTMLPACVLSMPSPNVNGMFTLTLTFSEPVTGLGLTSLVIANADVSNLQQVNATTYTLSITPRLPGTYTTYLPAGSVQQAAGGNDNKESNKLTFNMDQTAPEVSSVGVPANGYYRTGDALDFSVTMSETTLITGVPSLPITIGSTTVQADYISDDGSVFLFRYVVQAGNTDLDGIAVGGSINLNGGTLKDVAGNNAQLTLKGVGNTSQVLVSTAVPTVVLSTTAASPVGKTFTIKAAFSEKVTGLTAADFMVTNASIDPPFTTDGGLTYTIVVKPVADGGVSVSLPANSVVNIAGTGNIASNTLTSTADITPPQVTAVSVPPDDAYAAGRNLVFQVWFNEPIAVTGTPSIALTIGSRTVQVPYLSMAGANSLFFSYQVMAGDSDADGVGPGNVIQLNGAAIKDAAGNDAELTLRSVPSTSGVIVNTAIPAATLSTLAPSPINSPFVATATFSEMVTGLTPASFTVNNGTADSLVDKNGATYTFKITPAGEGPVQVSIPANAVKNNAHTGNPASNSLTVMYDATAPKVSSVNVPGPGSYKAGQPLNFTVNMSEVALISGTPSIPVIIGSQTVQAICTGGSGTAALTFQYVVQVGDMDLNGISLGAAMQLNDGTIKDAAGNNADLTLYNAGSTSQVLVTAQQLTVALNTTAVSPVRQAFPLKIVFSEAVTGFTLSDINVTNGSASQLQTNDNITYTALITPADGAITILVPAGMAQNSAGSGNLVSNTLNLQGDVTAPVVTSVGVPVNGSYKAGKLLNFSVQLSEPVVITGTPSIPVVIGTQTVQATFTGGTGTATLQFSYTLQNGDNAPNGIGLGSALILNGGTIKDFAGNDAVLMLQHVPATNGIVVKTGSPSVILSSTSSGRINTPFTVKLSFSEVVTGLTAAAIQVTNGTAGTLQTADNINYTVVITPVADGNVTVQLPAGVAVDIAGNNNLASNQLSLAYDATAPVIAQQAFDVYDNSPAGTVAGQLTATDASGIVQQWTLATDGSSGALSLDANGRIIVKDNALLRGFAGKIITLQVSVSDGLNISTVVPVTLNVRISYVNKQPVMDPVADVYICAATAAQTIQLTGVSPVEPGQHYTITLMADQPYFDVLSADVVTNTIRYQLKPGVTSGNTAITITVKDDGGTDNGGKDTYSQTFYLTVNPLPGVSISSDKGTGISKGDIVTLTATGAATYSWQPASGASGDLHQPTLTVRPNADATYQVTGTNAAGCSAVATISIHVADDYKLDATNLLTPNGDGKNDRWVIRNLDSYPDNEVKIFDRTGRLVYQHRNYSNDWDGTLNGRPLAEGTYYYVLTVNGTSRVWKGFITIIRNDQ